MKRIVATILVLILALSFVSCGGSDEKTKEISKDEDSKGLLGVVMPKTQQGYVVESIAHAQAEIDKIKSKSDIDIKLLTSENSLEQNAQLDRLVADGADCIVLWPHNGDEERLSAQAVMRAGIPIIVYDRLVKNFKPTAEIMGDNEAIGKMVGEYFDAFFTEGLGEGKVNLLEFMGDNSTITEQRSAGFKITADANFHIVQQFTTDWQRSKAKEQLEAWLISAPIAEIESIRGIFTYDDEIALGVLDALNSYNGAAKLDIRLVSGVGGSVEYLDTFAPWAEKAGKNLQQVTYAFSPAMVRQAIDLGASVILDGAKPSELTLIKTQEIDNTNEKDFRKSETFKNRYSLNKSGQ